MNILQNLILTSLGAGWGTCFDVSNDSKTGLVTAGKKRPENFRIQEQVRWNFLYHERIIYTNIRLIVETTYEFSFVFS